MALGIPNRAPPPAKVARALADAPAWGAALGTLALLALVLHRAVDVPFSDEWDWTDLIYAAHQHTLTFASLWEPHNEHRLLVPNLIMLALDAAGGWSVVREQIVSLMFLGLTQLVAWLLIRRTVPAARRGMCMLGASALLLSLVQYENFEWGFQLAWFLCNVCVVLVVWLLTRPPGSARDLGLALAAAVVASFSSSQGLLAWPVGLAAIALVPRSRLGRAVVWLIGAAVVTTLARAGVPQTGAGYAGLAHAAVLAQYALVYLGSPVALSFGVQGAALAGALLLAWLAALAVLALRGPLSRRIRLAPWLALASYPLLAAVATAFGRAGFGLAQAASSRYTSIAVLAWAAALAASCIAIPRGSTARFTAAALVVALAVAASLHQSQAGNLAWRLHVLALRDARAAIDRGDMRGLSVLYPSTPLVIVELKKLGTIRDGIFAPQR